LQKQRGQPRLPIPLFRLEHAAEKRLRFRINLLCRCGEGPIIQPAGNPDRVTTPPV